MGRVSMELVLPDSEGLLWSFRRAVSGSKNLAS